MINGGSSSGVAVAVQGLCQEAGIIFMAGLTHSNDTTGKDRKANGFRHFFDAYMSGAALAPVLAKAYGTDRRFYMLTSDYTWGWTQADSMKKFLDGRGLGDGQGRPHAGRRGRLLVLHHAGPAVRRRRADPQPLRRRHDQLADPVGAVRSPRQAGQRQELRDRRSALFRADGRRRRREHQGRVRLHELELAARQSRHQGLRQVVRREVRPSAVELGADLLRADPALCRCGRAGRHLQSVRRGRGAGREHRQPRRHQFAVQQGLPVRRHGQRQDALPFGRPPVLQGRAGHEGQGKPDQQVRHPGDRGDHAGRTGLVRAGQRDVRRRRLWAPATRAPNRRNNSVAGRVRPGAAGCTNLRAGNAGDRAGTWMP